MGAEGEWEDVATEPEDVETPDEPQGPEDAYEDVEPARPARTVTQPDKSILAMLSGFGFFVSVLLLVFGVWSLGGPVYTALTVVGLFVATPIPYLWMLDDLRVRPKHIPRTHARFMTGPLIGVLAIIVFGQFSLADRRWLLAALGVTVVVITAASVSLFLYSMLWEE
jgi:hypothetical protein